jgi:hypothetical protein
MVEDWFFSRLDLTLRDVQTAQDNAEDLFGSLPFAYLHQLFVVLSPLLDAGHCIRREELN